MAMYVYAGASGYTYMRTNVEIDDTLMAEALRESGVRTKRESVELALREFRRFERMDRLL